MAAPLNSRGDPQQTGSASLRGRDPPSLEHPALRRMTSLPSIGRPSRWCRVGRWRPVSLISEDPVGKGNKKPKPRRNDNQDGCDDKIGTAVLRHHVKLELGTWAAAAAFSGGPLRAIWMCFLARLLDTQTVIRLRRAATKLAC